MNERVRKLTEEARRLTPEEQADLFDALLVMMHEQEPPLDKAWEEEIERRVAQLDRGEATLHDADEVLTRLRARCV